MRGERERERERKRLRASCLGWGSSIHCVVVVLEIYRDAASLGGSRAEGGRGEAQPRKFFVSFFPFRNKKEGRPQQLWRRRKKDKFFLLPASCFYFCHRESQAYMQLASLL